MVAFSVYTYISPSLSCCVLGSRRPSARNFASHQLVADAAVFRDRAQPAAVRRANVHRTPLHAPSSRTSLLCFLCFLALARASFSTFRRRWRLLSRARCEWRLYTVFLATRGLNSRRLARTCAPPAHALSFSLTPSDRSPECARADDPIRSDITRTEESRSASCRVTQLDLRSPRARACCRLRSRVRARACFHVEGTVFARQFAVSVLRGYR